MAQDVLRSLGSPGIGTLVMPSRGRDAAAFMFCCPQVHRRGEWHDLAGSSRHPSGISLHISDGVTCRCIVSSGAPSDPHDHTKKARSPKADEGVTHLHKRQQACTTTARPHQLGIIMQALTMMHTHESKCFIREVELLETEYDERRTMKQRKTERANRHSCSAELSFSHTQLPNTV